jgi:hypothetical protein
MYIDTKFETTINIPYGKLKDIVDWCSNNCEGEWGYTVVDSAGYIPGNYKFKFKEEKDFFTFLLWKQ